MYIGNQPALDGTMLMLNHVHHDDIPMPLPDGAAPRFEAAKLWGPWAAGASESIKSKAHVTYRQSAPVRRWTLPRFFASSSTGELPRS